MADTNDTVAAPTAEQIAAVRAYERQQALATADEGRAAMIEMVTSDDFAKMWSRMVEVQTKNPGNVQLNYAIGMFDQMRAGFTPA